MRHTLRVLGAVIGLAAVTVFAQTIVVNPTRIVFQCPDHAQDTNHDVQILRQDGTVLSTLTDVGDPAAAANGDVTLPLNVQPIAFGSYTARVRAKAGTSVGEWSNPTAVWSRSVETPTGARVER